MFFANEAQYPVDKPHKINQTKHWQEWVQHTLDSSIKFDKQIIKYVIFQHSHEVKMLTLICTKTWGTCRKAVALLNEKKIVHAYREYKQTPLSQSEIKLLLKQLDTPANHLLRKRDKAYKALALTGDETDEHLIPLIAKNPTLLQRPIAVFNNKAVVARPVEKIISLVEG